MKYFKVLRDVIPCFAFVTAMVIPILLQAGEANVENVSVDKQGDIYTFHVSVKHNDEGWDHYANRWDVLMPDGTLIASRVLAHPHVNEQPFTRSLSGVKISSDIEKVFITANDSVHGLIGNKFEVVLPH